MQKIKFQLLTILCLSSLANSEMIKVENIDGIVIDTDTKLIWQNNGKDTSAYNQYDAIYYCKSLSLGGFNDWKLPDFDTLKTFYTNAKAMDTTRLQYYWSSSNFVLNKELSLGGVLKISCQPDKIISRIDNGRTNRI